MVLYPVDEWVRLRRAGSPVEMIALYQGVSSRTVSAVTARYGPFRRVTRTSRAGVGEMVARRQAGQTATLIARELGVSRQWVSKATLPHGPFPRDRDSPETVAEWVAARQARVSLAELARQSGRSAERIARATKDAGPYPWPSPTTAATGWSIRQIGKEYRVAPQTVRQWIRRGHGFPPPGGYTRPDRPCWDPETVRAWAAATLATCPKCGAGVLSVPRHAGAVHG